MPTINKILNNLSYDEVLSISDEFLRGWHDLSKYGFRLKGFNHKREFYGLPVLTKQISDDYRVNYVLSHYSADKIVTELESFLVTHRVDKERWAGIELFECRFGREYARLFKRIVGASVWRKLSEKARVQKLVETQEDLYGGVGLAGKDTYQKAVHTNLKKYGVSNVMHSDVVKSVLAETNQQLYGGASPFSDETVRDKAVLNKAISVQFNLEKLTNYEKIVYEHLCAHFGEDNVLVQYGRHPYDKRYPFSCDFYIKTCDLFIEINAHYSHGGHWFDSANHDDVLRKNHLLTNGAKRSLSFVRTWCELDVEKRKCARDNKLNYLVFWDGAYSNRKMKEPRLKDFYCWFYQYDCDVDRFLKDFPECTYF